MNRIKCPWCEAEMTDDEMQRSGKDLLAICPNEEAVEVQCPWCNADYVVSGSYTPKYETFIDWERYEKAKMQT